MRSRVFLIILAFALPSVSLGIGEIERVLSWGGNFLSGGAMLAEIENQRMKIQARYDLKKAQLILDLETQYKERVREVLSQEVLANEERIRDLEALLQRVETSKQKLASARDHFDAFRASSLETSLRTELLLETVRQEVAISPEAAGQMEVLLGECRAWSERLQAPTPACFVLAAFGEGVEDPSKASWDHLLGSPERWKAVGSHLRRLSAQSVRLVEETKFQLEFARAAKESVEARLKELNG